MDLFPDKAPVRAAGKQTVLLQGEVVFARLGLKQMRQDGFL